jgi:hypothetical protein
MSWNVATGLEVTAGKCQWQKRGSLERQSSPVSCSDRAHDCVGIAQPTVPVLLGSKESERGQPLPLRRARRRGRNRIRTHCGWGRIEGAESAHHSNDPDDEYDNHADRDHPDGKLVSF